MAKCLIANDRVVAEEFEGELVLIDVEKGLYFSVQGAAMDLWRSFSTGQAPESVVGAYVAQVPGVENAVLEGAIGAMVEHEILIPSDAAAGGAAPDFAGITFAAPVVEVYSDLAELIAIDPVHEVDAAAGWPLRPASFPDAT